MPTTSSLSFFMFDIFLNVSIHFWWTTLGLIITNKGLYIGMPFSIFTKSPVSSKWHFFVQFLHIFLLKIRDSNLVDSASSIRLSQRLSHACLSINKSILWNCEWLIISVIVYLMVFATWITVVILELIHASIPDSRRGVFIRLKPMRGNPEPGDS